MSFMLFDHLQMGPNCCKGLADNLDAVIMTNVPQMNPKSIAHRDSIRRMILLVDELYEKKKRLHLISEFTFDELFDQNAPIAPGAHLMSIHDRETAENARMGDASQRWTNLNAYVRRSPFAPAEAASLIEAEKLKDSLKFSQDVGTEERFQTERCVSRLLEMETW
jgi:predicted ATPase